jgi:integrase
VSNDLDSLAAQVAALTAALQAFTGAKAAATPSITVAALADRYARGRPKAAYTLVPFLKEFGARDVAEVRKADYLHWRDEVRARELTIFDRPPSIGTLNQELTIALAMFRWGIAHDLVATNPHVGVRKLKGQRPRETEIDPHEHAQALANAPLLVRVFQAVCIETGMRNGCEVRLMERGHIDRARSVIQVPRANAKGKTAAREVPMSDYLRALLDELPPVMGTPFIFANPRTKKPYSYVHLQRIGRPYLDKLTPAAGDRRVVTHDGRHSLVSRLVRGGVHPFASMKIVGHQTASMHWRYTHVSDADRSKAKALLDDQRKR